MPRQLRVEFPGAIYHLMSRGYTYDPAWNLTKTTNNTSVTTRTVNNLNQITVSGGSYAYDANGNRSSYTGNYSTYVYDDENQLVQRYNNPSFYSGATKTDFTYDGKGRLRRRIEHSWNSTFATWIQVSETRYIYSGMLAIQERSGSNVPEVSYTRGWDLSGSMEGAGGIGGLLARSRSYSSGTWGNHDFYHADGNGNIIMMLDSSQATVATYKYDPYGNSFTASGSLASANLYRFSSKLWCGNAGLYYYGYRFYDPSLQRWLNRDPIGERGGLNLYAFTKNRPTTHLDAFGMQPIPPDMGNPEIEGCSQKVSRMVREELDRKCKRLDDDKAQNCCEKALGKDGPSTTASLKSKCQDRSSIHIRCAPKGDEACQPPSTGRIPCASATYGGSISLCPGFLTGSCGDMGLGCILIHELTHTVDPKADNANEVEKCLGCSGPRTPH
jgi:RHS repeat-associated protein